LAEGELPPKANPAVCVPHPAKLNLAVFKSLCSDQLDPLYSSVSSLAVPGPVSPPNPKPAV
jgi:hypothetical protein